MDVVVVGIKKNIAKIDRKMKLNFMLFHLPNEQSVRKFKIHIFLLFSFMKIRLWKNKKIIYFLLCLLQIYCYMCPVLSSKAQHQSLVLYGAHRIVCMYLQYTQIF